MYADMSVDKKQMSQFESYGSSVPEYFDMTYDDYGEQVFSTNQDHCDKCGSQMMATVILKRENVSETDTTCQSSDVV